MISVTFIIFTYNSIDVIERTHNSLQDSIKYLNQDIDYEIIYIDNNSNDNTFNYLKKHSDTSSHIRLFNNPIQGLSYSRKLGVSNSTKDYVCFIDDDNFLDQKFVYELVTILEKYRPDVVGGVCIGIASIDFPKWWNKYKGHYACGVRYNYTGFLKRKLDKMWGAGLTVKRNLLFKAITEIDLFCTDRIGNDLISGGDTEINYRLRLLGASFYHSTDLKIYHFMRENRLTYDKLKETIHGAARGAIRLDSYKYLLTGNLFYHPYIIPFMIILFAVPLSIKYKINYFKYGFKRLSYMSQSYKNLNIIKKTYHEKNIL